MRKSISIEQRQAAAHAAAQHLANYSFYQVSHKIACYLSVGAEFDSSPILKMILSQQKCCYLPVLTQEKKLQFVRYREGDTMHLNQYRIPEPANLSELCQPEQLDLVILPLVAYDSMGNRLGAGGGYYDRTFAFKGDQINVRPQLLGLAYEAQAQTELPFDAWDVKLDGVITEKDISLFASI